MPKGRIIEVFVAKKRDERAVRYLAKHLNRYSPDDSRTGASIGAFPAFPQDRYKVWTAISASASPNRV